MARTGVDLSASEILWVQQGDLGILRLAETTAPSVTSGIGKLYVKSSDSKLYYKDDSGTEVDLTAAGAGANTALSNLASVAINTTLVSDTDNTDALGTTAIAWSDLFLGSGAVIQWNSAPSTSDVTLTHSANALAFAGGTVSFDTAPTVGVAAVYYAGGTDVAVLDGGTGLSAIAALSTIVANSSNTYVAITPAAGQSIRINAGNTAWEAYTPGTGTVTAVSIASSNGFAGTSGGGATPILTISTSITGVLKGNGTAISAATAGSDYAVGSIGLAGGQTIAGSTLTNENLTLRANAADLTTGAVIVSSSKEASSTTVGSVQLAGGLAVAKRVYALDMTVTNTITGTTSGNLVSGGALGTPSSGTGTNITGIPAASILAGSFGAGAYVISTTLQIGTGLIPDADDGAYLGQAGSAFSDLFLAEGGVINWDSSDITLTQTNNELVLAGGNLDIGTNAFRESGPTYLKGVLATDDTFCGPSTASYNAGATIAQWDLVYLDSSSTWQLADADAASTSGSVMLGVAAVAGSNGVAMTTLLPGAFFRNDGATAWTVGGTLYAHTSSGKYTQTQPSGTDDVIRVIGWAMASKTVWFNPSSDYVTHT